MDLQNAPSTSFAKLKLSELVANLAGKSNAPLPKILLFQRGLILYQTFAVHTYNIDFDKFCKWTALKYDNATTAQQFVIKWRTWLDTLRPSATDSSEHILISKFSDFVISENQDLTSDSNFTFDPVSYNINASNKASSNKPKHFHAFRQRKAAHSSKDCFQNPTNTMSAKAVNTPASTTTTTTTIAPDTLIGNPMTQSAFARAPAIPSVGVLLVVIAATAEFIMVTPTPPSTSSITLRPRGGSLTWLLTMTMAPRGRG
ncbi:unnamed protein product [Penicillium palitans]